MESRSQDSQPSRPIGREPSRAAGNSGLQFSSGAFQPPTARMKSPPMMSATPPRPPKGRFFIVGMVLTVLSFGAFRVWDSFFHYSAFGVVAGRTVEVPAPVTGLVRYVHVREGDQVRQGDLLLTLDQHELELRLCRLDDQLRMAQAKLDAELSATQWRVAQYLIEFHKASGEYSDKWAEVRERQVRWRRAQQSRARIAGMVEKKTAALDELEAALADEHAQRERLEALVEGLVAWQKRSQIAELQTQANLDVMQPLLAELKNLESEQTRLRDELARGQVRSPVNGTVLTRHRFTGEGADYLQTLFTILEENSLEIVLYVPQQRIDEFETDQTIDVALAPFQDQIACRVARLGDENVSPPAQVQRFYAQQAKLLPVHLSPIAGRLEHPRVQLGAVVQLPFNPSRWWNSGSPMTEFLPREARDEQTTRR